MTDMENLKEELTLASRILANEDLAQGFGHISVRVPGTDRFLIPRLMSPALVQPQDIITVNLAGDTVGGEGQPSAETWIHTCIYGARPDVNCVSHFHSFYVMLLGVVGQPIQFMINIAVRFADGVPIYNDPGLINTREKGDAAAQKLGQHSALMLRAHGATVVADELKTALISSVRLEEVAKMQVWANMIGKPIVLNPKEIQKVQRDFIDNPPEKRFAQTQRAWDYCVNRLPSQA